MFDDVQPKKSGDVPGNLPLGGEAEDMFSASDNGNSETPVVAMPDSSARPIGATSAVDAGLLKPAQTNVSGATPPFSQMNSQDDEMYRVKAPAIGRGALAGIILFIVVVIVGGGGWWIYFRYMRAPVQPPTITFDESENNPVQKTPDSATNDTSAQVETTSTLSNDIIDDTVLFGEPIDSDGDGLDDIREQEIGTNPNNWDTDGDGLGDRDEVISWKTNPNVPDTDGDGFLDGQEVRAGYNPNGPGKYTVPPTTTSK